MSTPINTPNRLRFARQDLGLSQAALAEQLGITRSAIQMMEYGTRPIERRTDLAIRYLLRSRTPAA